MPHNTQDLHSQTRHPPHTPWSGRANHGTTRRFPPPHIFTHTFAPVPRHHPLLPQISAPILRLYFSVTSFFSHIHNLPKCYIHSFPELPYYCLHPCVTIFITFILGLPRWFCGKESTCKFRRHRFSPWVRKIPWRRKWQPTPVFLPGKSHGQKRLAGYSPWSHKVLDTTEWLSIHSHTFILIYYVCINFHLQGYDFSTTVALFHHPGALRA